MATQQSNAIKLSRSIAAHSARVEELLDNLPNVTLATCKDAETNSELQAALFAINHAAYMLAKAVRRETARFESMGCPEVAA